MKTSVLGCDMEEYLKIDTDKCGKPQNKGLNMMESTEIRHGQLEIVEEAAPISDEVWGKLGEYVYPRPDGPDPIPLKPSSICVD